jgi:choline trimethylamine-lyase activating enzyme
MPSATSITGRIFDIQKFSVHDGPGIRTLVFFKGCPLHCTWCSNPEGISSDFQPFWVQDLCVSCGGCAEVCAAGIHRLIGGDGRATHILDRSIACRGCGRCVTVCPNSALRLAGREVTVAEVMDDVLKDFAFYANSGGGLTLGGGEPTRQPDFAEALLGQAKHEGLHTAMESCAMAPWHIFERLLPLLDLILVDIKHLDASVHQRLTGASNALILQNITHLLRAAVPLIVRVPLIPTLNDGANLRKVLQFVREHDNSGMVERIDIIPYHRFGVGKYGHLGLDYALLDLPEPGKQAVIEAAELAASFGYPVHIQPTAA